MLVVALYFFFRVIYATGGVAIFRFDTESECLRAHEFIVNGLAAQAPLRDVNETVTVTPCVLGEPPG